MGPNFLFGGGANDSTMTPFVLAALLIAVISVLVLPRRYIAVPILSIIFLTPAGQQLLLGGFHFYVVRIIVLAGLIRLAAVGFSKRRLPFTGGFNTIDIVVFLYALLQGVTFLLREQAGRAVAYEAGFWLDTLGLYCIFRSLIQDKSDIYRIIRVFAILAGILGICMSYEFVSRANVFSYMAGQPIIPWLRDGRVRAQGPFAASITAGAFGAALLPLFFLLWQCKADKRWASIGIAGASAVAFTSMSSTPITGYLAAVLALFMWRFRNQMRVVRWGISFSIVSLALVMKAPVWFVITHVNVAAGNAYDRAILISAAIKHFSEWWLLGTNNNANWGLFTWDTCNQYVSDAISGGLIALILLLGILVSGFSALGRLRKHARNRREEWFFWSFGAALFAHAVIFLGVDYFDQTRNLWFIFLATLSAATLCSAAKAEKSSEGSEDRLQTRRLRRENPALLVSRNVAARAFFEMSPSGFDERKDCTSPESSRCKRLTKRLRPWVGPINRNVVGPR